jgi:hypothetical protein
MRRPPYLRWIAAAALVLVALAFELESRTMATHPFLTRDVAPGEAITDDAVEWRPAPRGLLPMPNLADPIAAHHLSAGDPLTAGSVANDRLVPAGWWSIPLNLPSTARVGGRVGLVLLPARDIAAAGLDDAVPQDWVEGVVVERGEADAFSVAGAGLVAVPPAAARAVAIAAAEERLMVLYGS